MLRSAHAWSVDDRLLAAETGNTHLSYTYDYAGSRIGRVETSVATGAKISDRRYLADYQNLTGYSQILAETDAPGTAFHRNYVYSQGHEPLAQTGLEAPGTSFFHPDHLGTTRGLTSPTGSAIPDSSFAYTPFGDPTSGDRSLTNHHFTAQFREEATGLQWHRARWLDTKQTLWSSVDREWDLYGNLANLYHYGAISGLNKIDVSGTLNLVEVVILSAIVGALTYLAIDTYVNGWIDVKHAIVVASTGALLAITVVLLFMSAAAGLAFLIGGSFAEASLIIGLFTAPFGIATAGHEYNGSYHPRERRVALAFLVLSVLAALAAPIGGAVAIQAENERAFAAAVALQMQKNLEAIEAAKRQRTLEMAAMLRECTKNKGNFGIGQATTEEANLMGEAWVGPNFRLRDEGDGIRILISNNGLRQYRFPGFKPFLGKTQANFESRPEGLTKWLSNGHLDITDAQ